MWTSLLLLVKVAPVSGQVKYTPDTERQARSCTSTLVPWKELNQQMLPINTNNHFEADMIEHITVIHTSAVAAFCFSASAAASASSSLLTVNRENHHVYFHDLNSLTKPSYCSLKNMNSLYTNMPLWNTRLEPRAINTVKGHLLYYGYDRHVYFPCKVSNKQQRIEAGGTTTFVLHAASDLIISALT